MSVSYLSLLLAREYMMDFLNERFPYNEVKIKSGRECKPQLLSIACKCLFIPLQAIFLFRLPPGEKCALNA